MTSGCVTEVIVPARVVYAGQWENLPFLPDGYGYLGIQVYHQGIGVVMAEHVSNVGSEPQVAVEPISELDSGQGRLVVGDVSGLQAKAFLPVNSSADAGFNGAVAAQIVKRVASA